MPPNKSLDASGGGVFRNLLDAAKSALIRAAASRRSIVLTDVTRIAPYFFPIPPCCWRESETYQPSKDCDHHTAVRRGMLSARQGSANIVFFAVERVVSRALRRRLQSHLRFGSLPHVASHTPLRQGICTRLGWAACKSERLVSGSHSPGLFTDANLRLHSSFGA